MSKTKTPMELLEARKKFLNAKSERITNSLLDTLEYGQNNVAPILGTTILGAVYPNLPGFVQKLITRSTDKQPQKALKPQALGIISDGLLEILPFFLKGKTGIIASFAVKKLKDIFFK